MDDYATNSIRFYRRGTTVCPAATRDNLAWCEGCYLGAHACGGAAWCRHRPRLMRQAAQAFEVIAYAIDPGHDLVTYRVVF